MARISNNATHNASGKAGSLVYRQTKDGTVLSGISKKSSKPATENQMKVRDRFNEAAYYARGVKEDPVLKAFYEARLKPGRSIFQMALADHLRPPKITELDASRYNGSIGSAITVKAFDDMQVTSVGVRIEHADGTLVEEGDAAIVAQSGGAKWLYKATAANNALQGSRIIVSASDLPGNVTVKQQIL